ncbi:MAG: transcription antitermination factor NusB [Planctomycetota bacterium]
MPRSARYAAALALADAAATFPDIPLTEPDLAGLSSADARLSTAIHRTVLQRWLTLEHLAGRFLKQPVRKLPPEVKAVLYAGVAQLVFMDRLPAYAVIDESVKLVRRLDAGRSAGLVNAVLRKIADAVDGTTEEAWEPAADRVPLPGGGAVKLSGPLLPKPDNLLAHLAVAASVPMPLLQRWFKAFGREEATRIALHTLQSPPTFVIEDETPRLWDGSHEALTAWLAADPTRRVQDPASLASVAALRELNLRPASILDLCAGRGTKTRQLRAEFSDAEITAWDPDDARRTDLIAESEAGRFTVAEPPADQRFDLIVLDVPCSNTGVLARRPGARYRATDASLASLVALQRQIIERALAHAATGGIVLYCTCSIEERENGDQVRWLAERSGGAVMKSGLLLPQGTGSDYRDGSYHAVARLPAIGPGIDV